MHLRDRIVQACILLDTSLVVKVDLAHIDEHLSVDALRSRDLLVVELGDFEDVVDSVHEGCPDTFQVGKHLDYLPV